MHIVEAEISFYGLYMYHIGYGTVVDIFVLSTFYLMKNKTVKIS